MNLFAIEHPTRLSTPAEARALYARLGDQRVALRGFRTNDPVRIDHLVAAVDPVRDSTVSFEAGMLDERGWSRLDALAAARPQYIDVHAGTANLRAWADHAKVYSRLPDGGVEAVGLAFGTPLRPGLNRHGDTTVMIDPVAGYPLAVAITTPDHRLALQMFRALGHAQVSRGYVMRANEPAKAVLAPFVRGLGATVHVVLDVAVELACELATTCGDLKHDWQASSVLVEFPTGRIHGLLRSTDAAEREQWFARVAAALERTVSR